MPHSAQFNRAVDQAQNQSVTTYGDADASAADRPDYVNDLCKNQQPDVVLVRDVFAGTMRLRHLKERYLPKHAAEETEDYNRRILRATLFNGVRRTAKGLTGMIFKQDPIYEDPNESIAEHFENIDLAGRDLSVFAKDLELDAIIDGHALIYVDHPPAVTVETPNGSRQASLREEREAGVRPYWVQVKKNDVINVQWTIRNGAPFLTLVVFRETATEPVGRYGEATVERFRVLRPGSFEVWREEKVNNKLTFVLVDSGFTSLDYIPVVPVYADQTGFFESCPPLLDLAHENLDHWINRCEHKSALARARIPMPVFINTAEEGGVKWGANYSIKLTGEDAQALMLESTGAALGASRDDLKDTETRMAALGLSMLVRETRAAETAEGKRIDRSESDSQLATMARGLQDALGMALWMHADYMRLDRESVGTIKVNDDFADNELTPQMLDVLLKYAEANRITNETLWAIMQGGGALPEDFDAEDEADALEKQEAAALVSMARTMGSRAGGNDDGLENAA